MLKNCRFETACKAHHSATHIKQQKINFIKSGAVDEIRTAYYIHGPELMKLIFAVLYVSRMVGPVAVHVLHAVTERKFF